MLGGVSNTLDDRNFNWGLYTPKAEVVARHPDFYFRSAKHSPGGIGILVPNPSDVNSYV
jgi:hypothetical protein